MANTYEWKINRVECFINKDGYENVIQRVHWIYTAKDSETNTEVSVIGAEDLNDFDPNNFTSFDQVDTDMVVSWLEAKKDMDLLKRDVDLKLSKKISPQMVTLYLADHFTNQDNTEEAPAQEEVV